MIGILLRSARDFWNESFLLMVFNLIFAVLSIPGMVLFSLAAARRDIVLGAVALVALAPWPFVSVGLSGAAADAVDGRSLHLRTLFLKGRDALGPGYRWGALTLLGLIVLAANAAFYLDPAAPHGAEGLAGFAAALSLLVLGIWLGLSPLVLAGFWRDPAPSLTNGLRNLGQAFLLRPFLVAAVGLTCLLFFIAGVVILPLGLLLAFSWCAVVASRMMAEVLEPTGRTPAPPRARRSSTG